MTPVQHPALDPLEALFLSVERVANRLKQNATRRRPQAQLPPGVRGVMLALEGGPQTVPQIARERGTSRQSIQTIVNGLKADGWVALHENPAHQRSQLVTLTETGRAVLARDLPLREQWKAGLHGLALQDIEAATEILRRLDKALERRTRPSKGHFYDVEIPVVPLFIRESDEYERAPARQGVEPTAGTGGDAVPAEPAPPLREPEPDNELPVSLL